MSNLKSVAEEINTNWCYYIDGDIYIHFFDRMKWFENSEKVKPTPSDIMKYRIVIPVDDKIEPPNADWDDLFVDGCMYSNESKESVEAVLDDWGFIDIQKVKKITKEEEKVLMI